MKKITIFLLVISMILPTFAVSFAAESADNVGFMAVNLSSINKINQTGLTASSEYSKSGSFTALLSGANLHRSIDMPVLEDDFTKGEYLEFYLYSPAKYNTRFALALFSDNPDTICKDYYYTTVSTNFEGWKLVSLKLSDFVSVHTPKGLGSIDIICIMPYYGGFEPASGTELYFDSMFVRSQQSPGANEVEGASEQKPYVLIDPENGSVGGGIATTLDGVPCLKWSTEELLQKPISVQTTDKVDFSQYGELKIRAYSEKATNNPVNVVLTSNVDGDSTWRYYKSAFSADWAGEWREFTFDLKDGASGSFSASRDPAGWDKIQSFELSAIGWSAPFYPDTVIYIGKVTLEGTPKEEIEIVGDYILEDQYNAESMTDYASMIKQKNPDKTHPRLILTDDKIQQIKAYKDTDSFLKTAWAEVLDEATDYLETDLTPAGTHDGKRLDWTPSTLIPTCALAYLITDDVRYKDRAWAEIENICSFPNWNTKHFLDTGEYSRAVAFAYDWLYDDWTDEQKQTMRNAVMKHAYAEAVKQLRQGVGSWLTQRSNWIEVGASGMLLCAMAFADEEGYENICNEIMSRTVEQLPVKGLFMFAPDGAYSEGMGYWNYALYTFYQMTSAMHTAIGTDMDLENYSGLPKTGYFPFAMMGSVGSFAFSDSSPTLFMGGAPVYHYVGMRYNIPNLVAYRVNYCDVADYRDIVWYDPEYPKMADYTEGLPFDYFASGYEPLGSFRTGYSRNSYYFGFKGGNNNGNHDQYDIGSFVIDANGVRWAEEIGPETYYGTDQRFTYYRNRAEGNNTLVINPDGDIDDQTPNTDDSLSDYISKGSNDGAAYGVFDMTKAYKADLTKAHRGFALVNNRTQFIIRDEITAPNPSEVYSFFHVKKAIDVDIANDGKSLMLTSPDGKKCAVNLVTSVSGAKFGLMDAVHLPTSVTPKDNDGMNNSDFQKFYIHAEGVTEGDFTVVYTPLLSDGETVKLPDIKPLSDWDDYITSSVTLSSISIDGIPVSSFAPGVANYTVSAYSAGTVSAESDDGNLVSVSQASAVGDTAVITVKSVDGTQQGTYKVRFEIPADPPVESGAEIVGVKASDVPQVANTPNNTIDGDINTRWSAEGEPWIEWDLGTIKTINGVSLAFMSGDVRRNVFKIEVSEDGTNYTTVFDGKTSGKTLELEKYDFDIVWARYVRYTGYGCENFEGELINPWNSITEVVVHETFTDFEDTIGHWASEDINYMRRYGLVNGVSDTNFEPDSSVSAAQFIVMICRALGLDEASYTDTFADVSADDWYAPYVASAVLADIIPPEMTKDGNLNPNSVLTRAQMSAIAVKAYESVSYKETPTYNLADKFPDVAGNEYASYIDRAITLHLVNGITDTAFEPDSCLTRAQAATIVKRLFVKIYNDFN